MEKIPDTSVNTNPNPEYKPDPSRTYVLKPGERVYEINLKTGNVEEARYKVLHGKSRAQRKTVLQDREGYAHIPALNKAHAKKKFDNIVKRLQNICSVCGAEHKHLVVCQRCENKHCNDCQAVYNQHTQIDFDCCKTCAELYE